MLNKRFLAMVTKEFKGYLNSPMAYLVIVPFLLVTNFLFFRTALVLGDANLRPFIELLPWFLVVLAPALTMRLFAEEQKRQTSELLFAHPVTEWQIVMAKFLGIWSFYGVILASTLAMPLVLIMFSRPDYGLMFGQYLGAALVGGAFLAVGTAMSAFVGSSVGAFLIGAVVCFGLILIGMDFVVLMFPGAIGRVVAEVAVMNHLTNVSRGVIDLRDLLYFATLALVALSAAVVKLSERKVVEMPAEKRKLYLIIGLIIGVGVLGNVVLFDYPIRLDVTAAQRYTLSSGTRQLLKDLPDRVNVTLYTSPNLPGPMQVTLRETTDLLKDLRRFGSELSVRTVVVNAAGDEAIEARSKGIREVQFNQIATGSFQVQTGYLGMEMRYGDKTEVIDFIEDAANLEYDMARLILKLTKSSLTKVGLVNLGSGTLTVFNEALTKQYQVINLTNESKDEEWRESGGVVVIDDGNAASATVAAKLKSLVNEGKNLAVFVDGVNVNQQSLTAKNNNSEIVKLLPDLGISLNANLVYDAQLNEAITLGSGNMRYIVSYPFWIRPMLEKEAAPWSGGGDNVVLGWASSLSLSDKDGFKPKPLLQTSDLTNTQKDTYTISPEALKSLEAPKKERLVVAASATKESQRIAVVADTQVLTDDFLQNTKENVSFVSNLVDWVAADPILTSIPKRTAGRYVFTFKDPAQLQITQYAGMLLPPVLVGVFGFWWLKRRKHLTTRVYEK